MPNKKEYKVTSQLSGTSEPIEEVLVMLRRLIRATDLHSKQLVKTAGITGPQVLLLRAILENGEVTIGEIANQVSLSQATVTSILDRLEKRGLVYRARSKMDKRKVHAYLTPEGKAVLANAPPPLQEHFISKFSSLESWEQSMILSSLQRVVQMMNAENLDAAPMLEVGELDSYNNPLSKTKKTSN
ncbi:MarR family winged helix-turn-helix transcriptional regulator [Gayadomonas joobiniege]|uniref:MarR family winged helix-turn-helix transcriptional regulator n=1 Tax=Gayadomonas joobiniege TaxID=1234606 RepID=UPI00036C1DB9|nr:MarR family transcriptional regulator [Gayadomonas joobiniege]